MGYEWPQGTDAAAISELTGVHHEWIVITTNEGAKSVLRPYP